MRAGTIFRSLSALIVSSPFLLAEKREKRLYVWGFNKNGQLGLGHENNTSFPQLIKGMTFQDVHAMKSLSAAIGYDGRLYTWGKNRSGVLGHSPPNLNILEPKVVDAQSKENQQNNKPHQNIVKVSCGSERVCALTQTGRVLVWGLETSFNKLVRDPPPKQVKKSQLRPHQVQVGNIVQVSCAGDYVSMVDKDGKLFVMGQTGLKGKNGEPIVKSTDVAQFDLQNVATVASGINFSLALTKEGKVYAWGKNSNGQLGTGSLRSSQEPVFLQTLSKQKIVALSCGDNYAGVINDKGEVFTWGFGNQGQLGHGDKSDQHTPRKVAVLTKQKIKSLSCGGGHTAYITQSGKLLLVGRGREGQLGREKQDEGNAGYSLVPKQVDQLPKNVRVDKVVCGGNHTMTLVYE